MYANALSINLKDKVQIHHLFSVILAIGDDDDEAEPGLGNSHSTSSPDSTVSSVFTFLSINNIFQPLFHMQFQNTIFNKFKNITYLGWRSVDYFSLLLFPQRSNRRNSLIQSIDRNGKMKKWKDAT